ncbi:MAG: glycogen debranching enzyme GlgX [Alphaproteobacteria bacterium]|nr:glycogen debranching enzyme GlgX [Alphaproteobacteria bacterium]
MIKDSQLGVSRQNGKVRFSVFSEHAQNIELCLFSDDEKTETRIPLTKDENNIWSAELKDIKPGQKYGYRAHGEFAPEKGLYFNPHKLLIDPFAKELSSTLKDWEDPAIALTNDIDSAYAVPKSVVVFDDPKKDEKDYPYLHQKPHRAWKNTVIYEANVKGFSALHPDLPEEIRGKFLAFAHPEVIQYLKSLGVTHLELMPVTTTCGGLQLQKEKGLSDYWGYNPINHFAFDKRYGTREDFKKMVNELHKAGIEVGLDVVYNHTGEYGAQHNLLSYKGLDAPNYYRMTEHGEFIDTTGCKNSINTNTPIVGRLLQDSLTYFTRDLGVDGFRFDLAGDCALDGNQHFDANGQFMRIVRQISADYGTKISGEPWSAMGGYYLGNMDGFMEWSDRNENYVRSFYRGDEYIVPRLAGHVSGGDDLWYGQTQSKYIRYVAAHDGFTAYDVVNYNEKNNWANNENNNDGNNNNHSSVSPSREIAFRRLKSMMTANILSRGVPMICAGDELARTQQGNNNAYCQDNELTWLHWKDFSPEQRDLYLHIRKLTALRAEHPTYANLDVFSGQTVASNGRKDIEWIRADGQEMQDWDWNNPCNHILSCVINGKNGEVSKNKASHKNVDDDFLIIMCGNTYGVVDFKLPTPPNKQKWELLFDTAGAHKKINDNGTYSVEPYSYILLTSRKPEKSKERTRGNKGAKPQATHEY